MARKSSPSTGSEPVEKRGSAIPETPSSTTWRKPARVALDLGPWRQQNVVPGPWNDYLRNYDEVDTISGMPFRTGAEKHGLKGFQAQDGMANETPGPIVDRSKEHLGVGDRVIIKSRQMLLAAVEDVRAGRDPRSVELRPAEDGLVHIVERDGTGEDVPNERTSSAVSREEPHDPPRANSCPAPCHVSRGGIM